jgi:hypothetical protein
MTSIVCNTWAKFVGTVVTARSPTSMNDSQSVKDKPRPNVICCIPSPHAHLFGRRRSRPAVDPKSDDSEPDDDGDSGPEHIVDKHVTGRSYSGDEELLRSAVVPHPSVPISDAYSSGFTTLLLPR